MKKKICAVLLSLCSVIGGAERKSDASIVGKVLKYGSAIVGSLDTLRTLTLGYYWCKFYNSKKINPHNVYTTDLPIFLWPNKKSSEIDMHGLIFGTVLGDLFCGSVHVLGKYLDGDFDKSNANQEKKSSKETVSDKNKSSKPEDKNQSLHEKSKKSKI